MEPSAHGHYVVMLYREMKAHFIYVTGYEQFEALEVCLTEAGLHMSGRFDRMIGNAKGSGSRRPKAGSPKITINQCFEEGPISVGVVTHEDRGTNEKYELALRVRNQSAGAGEKPGLGTDVSEVITISEEALLSFGEMFFDMSYAEYEPAFVSNIDEWFLPPALSRTGQPEELVRAELVRQAVAHINEAGIEYAIEWIEYLKQLKIPATVRCTTCLKFFGADKKVAKDRRKCEGCASGHGSSAYTEQQLAEVKILAPWLQAAPKRKNEDEKVAVDAFYTVGKDFAFGWMNEHPRATKQQLIEAVLKDQGFLPPDLARKTAEKIAERVFSVLADKKK
jgi:hypothetical protein